MNTPSHTDPDKLQRILERAVLPALQRTIHEASRTVLYEADGFCDGSIPTTRLDAIADDITLILTAYLTDVTHRHCAESLYRQITTHDLHEWAMGHLTQP